MSYKSNLEHQRLFLKFMLCILTRKRVLRMPFTGQNQFFDAKTIFYIPFSHKMYKMRQKITKKHFIHIFYSTLFRQNQEKSHFHHELTRFWVSTSIKESHLNAGRPLFFCMFLYSFAFFFPYFLPLVMEKLF